MWVEQSADVNCVTSIRIQSKTCVFPIREDLQVCGSRWLVISPHWASQMAGQRELMKHQYDRNTGTYPHHTCCQVNWLKVQYKHYTMPIKTDTENHPKWENKKATRFAYFFSFVVIVGLTVESWWSTTNVTVKVCIFSVVTFGMSADHSGCLIWSKCSSHGLSWCSCS